MCDTQLHCCLFATNMAVLQESHWILTHTFLLPPSSLPPRYPLANQEARYHHMDFHSPGLYFTGFPDGGVQHLMELAIGASSLLFHFGCSSTCNTSRRFSENFGLFWDNRHDFSSPSHHDSLFPLFPLTHFSFCLSFLTVTHPHFPFWKLLFIVSKFSIVVMVYDSLFYFHFSIVSPFVLVALAICNCACPL